MPNVNSPFGLRATRNAFSAPYSGGVNLYAILAADTNAFAIGDPVVSSASGASVEGIPAITLAAATGALRGVVVGLFDTKPGVTRADDGGNSTIRPAGAKTKDWYALVVDDPNTVFEVQEVGTGTPLTASEIGNNTNLVVGTNNGYISGWMMDNATEGVGATLQVRILGLVQRPDNTIGQYAKYYVKINNHELSAGTAGV